jgi:hypothetical protein
VTFEAKRTKSLTRLTLRSSREMCSFAGPCSVAQRDYRRRERFLLHTAALELPLSWLLQASSCIFWVTPASASSQSREFWRRCCGRALWTTTDQRSHFWPVGQRSHVTPSKGSLDRNRQGAQCGPGDNRPDQSARGRAMFSPTSSTTMIRRIVRSRVWSWTPLVGAALPTFPSDFNAGAQNWRRGLSRMSGPVGSKAWTQRPLTGMRSGQCWSPAAPTS